MVRQYRKFDEDFKQGAVRLVFETGKPIAQVARGLGSTRAYWSTGSQPRGALAMAGRGRSVTPSGPSWCGCAGAAELRMQRDVLERSVALRVKRRWAGRGGRVHRRPEGRARRAARGRLPGAGGQPGVVLQGGHGAPSRSTRGAPS
jgi:transposase